MSVESEVRRIPASATVEEQLKVIDEDGIIVVTNAIDDSLLESAVHFGANVVSQVLQDREIYYSNDDYGQDKFLLRIRDLQEKIPSGELLLPKTIEPLLSNIFSRTGRSKTKANLDTDAACQTAGMAAHILLPGGSQRPLHRDVEPLFSGAYPEMPVFSLAMHLPLTSFNERTGATRVAIGSHRFVIDPITTEGGVIFQSLARTIVAEPGDVIIFDNRIWHSSGVNTSDHARIMLSVLYLAEWFGKTEVEVRESTYLSLPNMLKRCVRICAS